MKKILAIVILLLTGCKSKNIVINDVISIKYNNIDIQNNDFNKVTDIINQMNFKCGKSKNYQNDNLNIITNNNVFKLYFSNNYYMEIEKNNNYCYTEDTKKVKNLIKLLDNTIKKYKDISYFTIRNVNNYELKDDDSFVKLDKGSSYIIINSLYPLNNFKISQIEKTKDNSYDEISVLYSIDKIKEKTNIVIRKEILKDREFKINFENEYGYLINILPIINENNEINFITDIK